MTDLPTTAILTGGALDGIVTHIQPGDETLTMRAIYQHPPGRTPQQVAYRATGEVDADGRAVFVPVDSV